MKTTLQSAVICTMPKIIISLQNVRNHSKYHPLCVGIIIMNYVSINFAMGYKNYMGYARILKL